mgnify:CR=1 FL=1
MATYTNAIWWVANNDGAGDTPASMAWEDAFAVVRNQTTACLLADVFAKDQDTVAGDVLKQRGFRAPRRALGQAGAQS